MSDLKIIVCLKQIPDPEGPPSAFKVDSELKKVTPAGIPPVINPFDNNALEAALQLKDMLSCRVVAISLGRKLAQPVLRKALSVGADELIILEDDAWEELDSYSTAYVLSLAIKKIGNYSLILTGRQAGDWDSGQTGLILAEVLGLPSVNIARNIYIDNQEAVVERLKRNGYEKVKIRMPALITLSSEVGELRTPTLKALKEAREKPVTTWNRESLQCSVEKLNSRIPFKLFPPARERNCLFIEGKDLAEKGEKLILKLREDRIL
jgi:electron transfer flavoprotein beta subunit